MTSVPSFTQAITTPTCFGKQGDKSMSRNCHYSEAAGQGGSQAKLVGLEHHPEQQQARSKRKPSEQRFFPPIFMAERLVSMGPKTWGWLANRLGGTQGNP